MTKKNCEHCGKEFPAQRNDARFCGSSCRSLFWQKNKVQSREDDTFRMQLKGLVNDNQSPVKNTITEIIPNKEYLALSAKLKLKVEQLNILMLQQQKLSNEFQSLQNPGDGQITLITSGVGAAIGYSRKYDKKGPDKRLANALKGGVWGMLGGMALEAFTKQQREKQRLDEIKSVNASIQALNVKITFSRKEVTDLKALISITERTLTVEKEVEVRPNVKPVIMPLKVCLPDENKRQINVSKPLTAPVKTILNVSTNDKIISSAHLTEMEYQALNFLGRWHQFFGQPSVNFHCAVHGMAGEGKSTFAIQFANYLAENFGVVIYISGEEGFSKTMKDKFINNNAATENLYLADLRTYQDLVNEVKPNTYNFIFIDSLDNMRIGALELKELRKLYINSALITISQSTKEGKMRGSYEIVHDSDIAVAVSDGVAKTVKNRFLEKGRTFRIFEREGGEGITPWNTVRG